LTRRRGGWPASLLAISLAGHAGPPDTLTVEVLPEVMTAGMPRLGLNLGEWSSWGAAQFMTNVIKNPGFEGVIDRTLVIVSQADFRGFYDDTTWTGRPDGFWAGARFDVATGPVRGASGLLLDSRQKGGNGLPLFQTRETSPSLGSGDVVILTRFDDTSLPASWWFPKDLDAGQIRPEPNDHRPGSPGARALRLETLTPSNPARAISYLDSIADRAGKLLPINGRWKLSFWVRAASPDGALKLTLQRTGSPPFLQERMTPAQTWQLIEREFDARDTGPAGSIKLEMLAETGAILLDDVTLAPASADPSGFRPEVVAMLKRLRPGYLRDWQGQLGETLDNRIAPPFARRAVRYRPGPGDGAYLYGLPEFLDLCKQVGSRPWVTLPTTWVGAEYEAFGRYLAQRAETDGFEEIVVEFGNENWNMLFRPAGIPNPAILGHAATEAFNRVRQGAGAGAGAPLRFAVDGQNVNPGNALRNLDAVRNADLLVVAPYLLSKLDQPGDDRLDSVWPQLFENDPFLPRTLAGVRERQRELSIYEVNLHTTRGSIEPELRNQVVAGAASGGALAKRLIQALNLGIRRQCVWNLAQYDAFLEDQSSLVKLWGITRDLGPTQRLRPTGLALAMLNQVLPGEVHNLRLNGRNPGEKSVFDKGILAVNHLLAKLVKYEWLDQNQALLAPPSNDADTLSVLAVRRQDGWALALVSANAASRSVNIVLPKDSGAAPRRQIRLEAAAPDSSNEDYESVRLVETPLTAGQALSVTVPPWGLVILTP
jgi:hypothetical protein